MSHISSTCRDCCAMIAAVQCSPLRRSSVPPETETETEMCARRSACAEETRGPVAGRISWIVAYEICKHDAHGPLTESRRSKELEERARRLSVRFTDTARRLYSLAIIVTDERRVHVLCAIHRDLNCPIPKRRNNARFLSTAGRGSDIRRAYSQCSDEGLLNSGTWGGG